MNKEFNAKALSVVIIVLSLLVVVKLFWVVVEYAYLPSQGISADSSTAKKSLYYRYRFASNTALQKIKKVAPKIVKKAPSIAYLKLVGIYSSADNSIVTILKGTKSYIIARGEDVDGFVLKSTTDNSASFEKAKKEYVLKLYEKKLNAISHITPSKPSSIAKQTAKRKSKKNKAPVDPDAPRVVSKKLVKEYSTNMNKIMRDIGLSPIRNGNNGFKGYKVRFVRRGSPFADVVGLKRGDIIKAVNGEDIVDLAGPMNMLKNADSIESLTLTIIRGNEEKELEYEVK